MFRRIAGSTRATLVAYLALFVVLGGGTAFAAKHYLITSTKQIKPNVLRALRGATGATGPVLTVLAPGGYCHGNRRPGFSIDLVCDSTREFSDANHRQL